VLISHRVAAIKDADQIIVLDQGRSSRAAPTEQLLAQAGLYLGLYRHPAR